MCYVLEQSKIPRSGGNRAKNIAKGWMAPLIDRHKETKELQTLPEEVTPMT